MAALICCSAAAQSHIDKIVDEIEQKGVDVSKVVKRDPKTKKPYSIVKRLTFYSKDGNYAKRLKEAFQKDAEDATEEKVEKKGNHYVLIFIDGKKKTIYTLDIQERQEKDPQVGLSIVMRDANVKENDIFDLLNNIGAKGIQLDYRGMKGLDGFENFDWSKYGNEFSDQDLYEIIQYGINSGISQASLVTELIKRGVKIDQIRRVRAQQEAKQKVKASEKG